MGVAVAFFFTVAFLVIIILIGANTEGRVIQLHSRLGCVIFFVLVHRLVLRGRRELDRGLLLRLLIASFEFVVVSQRSQDTRIAMRKDMSLAFHVSLDAFYCPLLEPFLLYRVRLASFFFCLDCLYWGRGGSRSRRLWTGCSSLFLRRASILLTVPLSCVLAAVCRQFKLVDGALQLGDLALVLALLL